VLRRRRTITTRAALLLAGLLLAVDGGLARAEPCTLDRRIKVVVGKNVVPVDAGTTLQAAPPVGEWSKTTLDGKPARVHRRYVAVACIEGPLLPPPKNPAKNPATKSAKNPATRSAKTSTKPTPTATTPTATTTTAMPATTPWPEPTPCKPAASRQLRRVREAARQGAPAVTVQAQAATARLLDPQCVEAHGWLAWAHRVQGDERAALSTWNDLHDAWIDGSTSVFGQRTLATKAVVRGRLSALRALRTTLPATAEAPSTSTPGRSGASIRLAVVGDVHFGRGGPAGRAVVPPDDGVGFLHDVAPALRAANLTLGNLETALADDGVSHKCSEKSRRAGTCFSFRAPTSMAARLAEAGVDVVSLANNHAGDYGFRGLHATLDALRNAGVATIGLGGATASLTVQGMRVALAAFGVGPLDPGIHDLPTMQGMVARLDADHDVVVVMFHGGAEGPDRMHVPRTDEHYLGENRGNVWAFAHAAVDAGADLVVGSGPHVLRGVETYRGRVIAYSLGNFSSWHTFPTSGPFARSGILVVDVAHDGAALAAQFLPTTMDRAGRPSPDPEARGIELVRRLSREDFGDAFFDDDGRWWPGVSTTTTTTTTRAVELVATNDAANAVCTLARDTPVFSGGRLVAAPAGLRVRVRSRGEQFSEVDLPVGRARIANALLAGCRG
jgi:poly-gamma-glutamate capsule biosynthesis protein CapA/YwtB (metallophosphatase superfamily)